MTTTTHSPEPATEEGEADVAGSATVVELGQNDILWLEAYRTARQQEAHWAEMAKVARQHLEAAMGDAELALVDGKPAVRWTTVYSTRLDQKKLKEQDPALYSACSVQGAARRFTLADPS